MNHHVILKVRTGSHCFGVNLPTSDEDFQYIVIPDIHHYFGLKNFHMAKGEKDEKHEEVYHSLNKFAFEAVKGNFSSLNLLHTRKVDVRKVDKYGQMLIKNRGLFLSKRVAKAAFGLCNAQLGRMKSIDKKFKAHGRCGDRTELVAEFGYDTKFAYHAYLVIFLATSVLKSGTYCTYLPPEQRRLVLQIRRGEMVATEFEQLLAFKIKALEQVRDMSTLPEAPNEEKVSDFFVDLLKDFYGFKKYTFLERVFGPKTVDIDTGSGL